MSENDDVPTPTDFHDPVQARAWVEDTVARRPYRAQFFAVFKEALGVLNAPLDILELGSGPGHLAGYLVNLPNVSRYAALDFSEAMHDLARVHLGVNATRVAFVTRDSRNADWGRDRGLFDAIVTMQAAHETRHRRHLPVLLSQAMERLKEGGVLLYCDHHILPEKMEAFPLYLTRAGQEAALIHAGFESVACLHDEHGMALFAARKPFR